MLRVGLTGDLGSGKSSVACLLAAHGASVFSSDEIARAMMQPGEPLYRALVERFGETVVDATGKLDRGALAKLAFDPQTLRVAELNALVHPPVIAEQERMIAELARVQPNAIVVVESALIFSAHGGGGEESQSWRKRFDCIVMVTAPVALKVERFVARAAAGRVLGDGEREALGEEARRRLAVQVAMPVPPDAALLALANEGSEEDLRAQVEELWEELRRRERALTR